MIARKIIANVGCDVVITTDMPSVAGKLKNSWRCNRLTCSEICINKIHRQCTNRIRSKVSIRVVTPPLKLLMNTKNGENYDWDGETGWVQALLSSKRLGLIQVANTKLYRTDNPSGLKAYLGENVILKIETCDSMVLCKCTQS